tara:strand:+ start:507 stop:665 length:159 start_codon:yes stop_codon:yes gene_type:complete
MDIWSANTQSEQANGTLPGTPARTAATPGLIGGMDLTTISALVVLASAFMRR